MKPSSSYQKSLLKALKDPKEAIAYLNAALEDGDKRVFLLAFRNVLEAQGGITKFSRLCKINRVSLYKMFSKKGNPELQSLLAVLNALGITLQMKKSKRSYRKAA